MLFCVLAVLYFCIDSSLAADEAIVVGEVYIYITIVGLLGLLFGLVTHTWRGYARSIETLQEQLREFKVEQARSACCDRDHENESLCDREILLQCIAAWYNSLGSFESQVQTEVRKAAVLHTKSSLIGEPCSCLLRRPGFILSMQGHAGDLIRQVVDLAQMFTYALAIYPVMAKLCVRLCYSLRARCRRPYMDFFLSMAAAIGAFLFYIACFAIQLYVFRQDDRELLLSVISMFFLVDGCGHHVAVHFSTRPEPVSIGSRKL